LKAHQNALQTLNEQLEIKVAMRTDELYKKNQKLEQAMMELKRTQQELIESEKMASLGNVVAGIAHEINTPLGVAITALTYNQECLHNINEKLQQKQLRQADLERSNSEQEEGYRLILRNLDRAQMLISNFKQVAVDQSSEVERDINVKDYIKDVFSSLLPLSKGKEITLSITGDADMLVNTYPGAIYQIMTNLFNNSMIHGFEEQQKGKVEVSVSMLGEHWLIIYRDDGVGMSKAGLKTLFDPFVTTKRSQGGCGLGMHIVYNLVTQLLKGEIAASSTPGQGIEVSIKVPYSPAKGEEMAG
jgi:C4-dicarboxylate-specific signal transduction histidine kinase